MSVPKCQPVVVRSWMPVDSASLSAITNWAAAHTNAHFRCPSETAEQWEARLQLGADRHPCLVAQSNGRPVGYAAGQKFSGGCGLIGVAEVSVYVDHPYAGSGIATQLYERLLPLLMAQGYCRLTAQITRPNPASERLHRRFGFRLAGVLERVGWKFDRWHDVSFWQRDLVVDDSAPTEIRSAREVFENWKASKGS